MHGLMKHQLKYFQQEYLLTENTTTGNCGRTKRITCLHIVNGFFSISSKADKLPFKLQKHTQVTLLNSKQNIQQFPHAMTTLDRIFNTALKEILYNLTISFLALGPHTTGKPLRIPSTKCSAGTASPFNTAGHQEVICSSVHLIFNFFYG